MDIVTLTLAKKGAKKYTDEAITGLGKGIIYKGAVDYYNNLPNNASTGDCYSVLYQGTSGTTPFGAEYVWGKISGLSNEQWIKLGEEADLSDYATIEYVNEIVGNIGNALDEISGEVI